MDRLGKRRKYKLIEILIINLFVLCYFKYYYLLLSNLFQNVSFKEILLPLGMSFYIFTIVSYVLDVYHRKIESEKNFLSFSLYVLFFPKLIMGPIVRYQDFKKQQSQEFQPSLFHSGCKRFVLGLSMKVILADTFSKILASYEPASMLGSILILFLYSFQIYYDFAGYTNMALGLSNLFGFSFEENFDYPYLSKSVGEFFRRWHITLGKWFRDYVYIPLGGSRVSKPRLIMNLLIVWLLTGMWHGATFNFILWGLFLGMIIAFEKLLFSKIHGFRIIRTILTFFIISISWVFFFHSDINDITSILKNLINTHQLTDLSSLFLIQNNGIYLIIGLIGITPFVKNIGKRFQKGSNLLYHIFTSFFLLILLCLSTAYLISYSYQTFLYFNF